MENDENSDVIIQRAFDNISACGQVVTDVAAALRYMLDDVAVASDGGDQQGILTAWREWREHVDTHRDFAREVIVEIIGFMDSTDYDQLNGADRAAYFDWVSVANNDLGKLDEQIAFYALLPAIDYLQPRIELLYAKFQEYRDTSNSDEIVSRGPTRKHRQRVAKVRKMLCYDIHALLKRTERIIAHRLFSELLHPERKAQYHQIWKRHRNMLLNIGVD